MTIIEEQRGGSGGEAEVHALDGWLDRLYAWRDRLLSSPRFHRFAAATPLVRGIARRHERALFDICAGFVYSQTLHALVRLGVIEMLREAPRDAVAVARMTKLTPEAAARLLDAAVSLRLLSRRSGGRYGLGMLGAAMAGDPGVAAMVEHHAMLYADLADPVALLRRERAASALADYWAYAGAPSPGELGRDSVAAYSALMAASQRAIVEDLLDAYPLGRHRTLIDVGGGEGGFLIAAARRWPHLKGVLFDLPPVAAAAGARFRAEGLEGRLAAEGGDFHAGALPSGCDAATLIRVALDHDDDGVRRILRAVHRSLAPGGALLVVEPMSGTRGAEPVADAYFGLYLYAMGRGRPRSPARLRALMREAGFRRIREKAMRRPLLARTLAAEK